MKHKDRPRIFQGVNRPEGITAVILDYFQNACSTKAAKYLRILMLAAALSDVQRLTHVVLHRRWELAKISEACANPDHRFERRVLGHGRI